MKFYLKISIKNLMFYLFVIFYVFILYTQHTALQTSVQRFTIVNLFSIIASNIFSLAASAKIVASDYEVLSFLENSKFERYMRVIRTIFIISIFTSLLSIITIIIFVNKNISEVYILKGIIDYFVLWNISNILAATIGATFSITLPKKVGILVALSIYILFIIEVYNFSMSTIGKLLNIFNDSTSILENILAQDIFNISYFLDKIFIIFLIILMMLIVHFIIINRKRCQYLSKICITIVCIILTIFMAEKNVSYTSMYTVKLDELKYEIESYEMNIEINNMLKNSVNIKLKVNSNINEIKLLLEDTFKINKVEINNEEVGFIHKDGVIDILYDAVANENLQIEIDYRGSVHVENNIGVDTYYANITAINLPGNYYFWYPTLNNKLETDYIVNISSFSTIFSNLDIYNSIDSKFKKKYTLKGRVSEVNLFAGEYKSVIKDGIEYVIPSTDNIDIFITELNARINHILLKPELYNTSEYQLEELKNYKYKKVIVGIWENNTMPYSFNNVLMFTNGTLIINYF
jgi:hypothetical protein